MIGFKVGPDLTRHTSTEVWHSMTSTTLLSMSMVKDAEFEMQCTRMCICLQSSMLFYTHKYAQVTHEGMHIWHMYTHLYTNRQSHDLLQDLYYSHQHVLHPMNLLALCSILSKYVHCNSMMLTNLMFQCIFLVTEAIHSDNIWRKCPHTSERLPEIWIWVYAKIALHQVRSDKQAFHFAFMHVYIAYYQVTVVTTSV